MNLVQLLGRLTSDPEFRKTQSGIASCKFTIAVDRGFKNKQTGERESDFITCMAWRQTAEFITRYWTKGKLIVISGSLRSGSYKDRNHEDVTHYTTDVLVDNAYFCGDKAAASPAQELVNQAQAANVETGNLDDYEVISDGTVPF